MNVSAAADKDHEESDAALVHAESLLHCRTVCNEDDDFHNLVMEHEQDLKDLKHIHHAAVQLIALVAFFLLEQMTSAVCTHLWPVSDDFVVQPIGS